MKTIEKTNSEQQADAQLESILEMVAGLNSESDDAQEEARQTIQEDALSVEVRSDWQSLGEELEAAEFCILLCTGGPAVRITGSLRNGEPDTAILEHQDWGTPWTARHCDEKESEALLTYARQFYFGA